MSEGKKGLTQKELESLHNNPTGKCLLCEECGGRFARFIDKVERDAKKEEREKRFLCDGCGCMFSVAYLVLHPEKKGHRDLFCETCATGEWYEKKEEVEDA